MSAEARVGLDGYAPEVRISDKEFSGLEVKQQRRIKERNRRWRLRESLKKLRAKCEAGHRDADKYRARIADMEEELGLVGEGLAAQPGLAPSRGGLPPGKGPQGTPLQEGGGE